MGGQSNLFTKPDGQDPFGASVEDFKTGIYSKEKRPNIADTLKKKAQADWEASINAAHNKIK